jgi:heterodisulfide reductase subunit B
VKYALFLGCSVPVRAMNYEVSVRRVAERLGVEFEDLPGFGCCGYPIAAVSGLTAHAMAARNLALAASRDLPIAALCSACSGFLAETAARLEEDGDLRAEVNRILDMFGLSYDARRPAEVRHIVRLLLEDVGEDRIRSEIKNPLTHVRAAVHYGCHYLRPRTLHPEEDPENPRSLDRLVELTGGSSISYEKRLACCGGAVLGIKEETSLLVAKGKLDAAAGADANAMVVVCPFCSVMFEGNQKKIEKTWETSYGLPVLYYPQLLGLAMGLPAEELGFSMNRIKARDLLDKVAAGGSG